MNGINILGYINKQFGLGEGVRSNVRSIKAANIPFVLNDFKGEISPDILNDEVTKLHITSDNPYPVNLIQINVDNFDRLINDNGRSYFLGKYNIGFWAWELEKFPTSFQQYIDMLDEIWVPSNFCLNSISQVSNKPVLRFMHSIAIPETQVNRASFNLPQDRLIFLTMFDYHSRLQRKNPYAVIEAYENSFDDDDQSPLLVIKTSLGIDYEDEKEKLKNRIKSRKNIILIEDILPQQKLYELMNSCDVYISLHRSEGFGLTMAEAMALGKPVIATGYSANVEFMNERNSYLAPFKLIPTGDQYLYPELENFWADVDIDWVSKIMTFLAKNPDERERIGQIAKEEISVSLAPKTIGLKIKERLDYIYSNCLSTKDQEDITLELKLDNILLTKKVDALKKIKAVQWKLSFKNLKNKLFGKTKKYIWED
ncbi:glycosyltransferase [Sphingobacterium sp. LRF_L2]|uniref:glycosyltransferase n=1 Tax=Sphingobacterium sp. LRF_L2 TaxID=3369421 RepID=UPI003F626739